MNKEDIIRMARACGINFHQAGWPELERFAALVEEAENEACAKVAEWVGQDKNHIGIAAAIRARGQA
jgi:hypothetical protein